MNRKKTLRRRCGRPRNVGERTGGRRKSHRKARTSKRNGTTKRTYSPFLGRLNERGRLSESGSLLHSNYLCPCRRIFRGRQRFNRLRVSHYIYNTTFITVIINFINILFNINTTTFVIVNSNYVNTLFNINATLHYVTRTLFNNNSV